jgi:hypothetical protein
MAVETLEDLMDAITSIVTIGMSGEIPAPRFVIFPSHAFGPVGWQHSPIGNRTGSHLGSCSASMRARNFDEERTGTGSRRSSRSNRQEVATRHAALLGARIAWA